MFTVSVETRQAQDRRRLRMELDGRTPAAALQLAPLRCAEDNDAGQTEVAGAAEGATPPGAEELVQLCPGEAIPCPGEMLPDPEAGVAVPRMPATYTVEMPPCHGIPGPALGELSVEQPLPPCPLELLRKLPPRGKCLMYNWEEERATNDLDRVPGPEYGSEGFFYRHGHPGILTLQFLAGLAQSTTMKDSYQRLRKTGLPVRGKRESMLEHLLYQKHSKNLLEKDVYPPPRPMESVSVTHRDYWKEGFLSVPPLATQTHDYRLEQPQSFWLEHAQQVPGVSNIRTSDTPFKKCATFTTPVSEYLDQPLPYSSENYPKL